MGIGVGLTASPSTAAILELISKERAKSAASITMGAQAISFAAALLLGGASTEYGPWPTRLCFWILAILLLSALFIQMKRFGRSQLVSSRVPGSPPSRGVD